MGSRIGCGVSQAPAARTGGEQAAAAALSALDGAMPDLAVVFCSGAHLADCPGTLDGVRDVIGPRAVLTGCGAGGVIAGRREIERGTAVSVWLAAWDAAGTAESFQLTPEAHSSLDGLPELDDATGLVLLPDPYSFAADRALHRIAATAPGLAVLGGLSSARTLDGEAALFDGDEVLGSGAVGVVFRGIELLPCVSQGATPIGPEMTITAAEGHIIHELAGRPALSALEAAVNNLPEAERALVAGGLLLGFVVDADHPEHGTGDFLVRGLLGADPQHGTVTVGAAVEPGQVVRLHARDAESADGELREALALRRTAFGGERPSGALVFACNGRGAGMFGAPDHDATALAEVLGDPPAAGFFAAGEIGPVGGQPFLHGFTATMALFAP